MRYMKTGEKKSLLGVLFILSIAILSSFAADTATTLKWYADTDRPAKQNWSLRRGETVVFEPYFRNYGAAQDLQDANTVIMRYKSADMTSTYFAATGSVYSATGGVCRIRWTAANEPTNSLVSYDIAVSGSSGTIVRAWGDLSFTASIADAGSTNTRPREFTVIDFATCDLQNVALAPFFSSYDLTDLETFDASLLNGTAALDVNTLNVRGLITGSAGAMTNFPPYLARTSDLYPTAITNISKGEDETPARLERNTPNTLVIHFPITGSQEIQTTNRLTWVVNGETIGYVDSNGVTMVKGSLQLFEEDLNCNVRAYDGSRTAPSVSFWASPLIGWYRKSYLGDYAWAFAHTSNDIFYIHRLGVTVAGTNVFSSYYFDSAGAYRYNGTNGGTTNLSVITSVLTNGSGAVTGTVSQTLRFRGGLFFNE